MEIMSTIKIIVGIAIIIASFIYVSRNKGSMLDNLLRKSKEEYERRQLIQKKAQDVIDGEEDAFDSVINVVKNTADRMNIKNKLGG